MTSVTNNIAAIAHVVLSFFLAFILEMISAGAMMIGFGGMIVGFIISAIAVFASAFLIKKFLSYPDKNEVIKMSSIINAVLTIIISLSILSLSLVFGLIIIVADIVIFYVISKAVL